MTEASQACFHCGEPVPASCELSVLVDSIPQPVCCNGCQAVAELIIQSGQAGYYRFRTETAVKPAQEDADIEQAWACFDTRESLWGTNLQDGVYELLLQVEGIRCAACAWLIRSQLESREGIRQVQVDVATGFVSMKWLPGTLRVFMGCQ